MKRAKFYFDDCEVVIEGVNDEEFVRQLNAQMIATVSSGGCLPESLEGLTRSDLYSIAECIVPVRDAEQVEPRFAEVADPTPADRARRSINQVSNGKLENGGGYC